MNTLLRLKKRIQKSKGKVREVGKSEKPYRKFSLAGTVFVIQGSYFSMILQKIWGF